VRGCQRDNGDSEFPTLGGGAPVCPDCEQRFRNRPFPRWIKASLAGLLALAVLSCVYNWRFLAAYVEMKEGVRNARAGDLNSAAAHLESAHQRVPEDMGLDAGASLYRGLYLLSVDKTGEALPHLRKALQIMPADRAIQDMVLTAEAGVAFERKDYDGFLERSKMILKRHPNDPRTVAGVASALACKWAVAGEESFKRESIEFLDRARRLAGAGDASFKEYEGRILYRLDSREIIDQKEFHRRFPHGYVPAGDSR
jgi:tetratricopeptide (TPR) repeat protein